MWQRGVLALLGVLGLALPGCVATRGWVGEQLTPLGERVAAVEGRISAVEGQVTALDARVQETASRVEGLAARLDHLRLERRFVLNLREGATFTLNSGALTPAARAAIDGFLADLPALEEAVFLVAGHTDNLGPEDYNYELGRRRAASVARYLLAKGVDPVRVTTVSYGESQPVADNGTAAGRRQNRRVEILVYKEVITAGGGPASSLPEARRQD